MGLVTLTENAAKRFREILSETPGTPRLSVVGKGCSGFSYKLEIVEFLGEYDEVSIHREIRLLLDPLSVMYVIGTEIDYETDLVGSRFTFRNPMAAASCGCGSSFAVKEPG